MDLTSDTIVTTEPWNDNTDLSKPDTKIEAKTPPRSSSKPVCTGKSRRLATIDLNPYPIFVSFLKTDSRLIRNKKLEAPFSIFPIFYRKQNKEEASQQQSQTRFNHTDNRDIVFLTTWLKEREGKSSLSHVLESQTTLSCHCHVPDPYYEEREKAEWEERHTKPEPCLTTTDTDLHQHEPWVTGEPRERGLSRENHCLRDHIKLNGSPSHSCLHLKLLPSSPVKLFWHYDTHRLLDPWWNLNLFGDQVILFCFPIRLAVSHIG